MSHRTPARRALRFHSSSDGVERTPFDCCVDAHFGQPLPARTLSGRGFHSWPHFTHRARVGTFEPLGMSIHSMFACRALSSHTSSLNVFDLALATQRGCPLEIARGSTVHSPRQTLHFARFVLSEMFCGVSVIHTASTSASLSIHVVALILEFLRAQMTHDFRPLEMFAGMTSHSWPQSRHLMGVFSSFRLGGSSIHSKLRRAARARHSSGLIATVTSTGYKEGMTVVLLSFPDSKASRFNPRNQKCQKLDVTFVPQRIPQPSPVHAFSK